METLKTDYLKGVDAVIHLVGIIQEYQDNTFERVHVEGTKNIVELARANGVNKFIHMSALGSRQDGRSAYHRTKWAAEEIVRNSGIDFTIFRPSIIFGGPPCEFIDQMLDLIKKPLFTPVAGSGSALMQPVYVMDVARLFANAIENRNASNKTFDVGGRDRLSFSEIIDALTVAYRGKPKLQLHIPLAVMYMAAFIMQNVLQRPPVTTEQLKMLEEDNVCDISPLTAAFNINFKGFREWCGEVLPHWHHYVRDEEKIAC